MEKRKVKNKQIPKEIPSEPQKPEENSRHNKGIKEEKHKRNQKKKLNLGK